MYGRPRDLPSFPTRPSSQPGGREVAGFVGDDQRTLGRQRGGGEAHRQDALRLGERERRALRVVRRGAWASAQDRKSTRLNSSHANISYAVFCLKKKKITVIL